MTRMLKKAPSQDDFFDHAIGSGETSVYTVQIGGWEKPGQISYTRYVHFPREITSSLQLEAGKSVKWSEQDSKFLTMTPLPETTIHSKVTLSTNNLLLTTIPMRMLAAGGLNPGDYVRFAVEDGCLSVRKAEEAGADVVKIGLFNTGRVTIPRIIAEELGVKKGMFAIWQFDETGLWIKFQKEDPHLATIIEYSRDYPGQLSVSIPDGVGMWIKKYEYAAMQVKEKKLYMSKKV